MTKEDKKAIGEFVICLIVVLLFCWLIDLGK